MQGTKYFEEAVFHQKSKIYDVVSLLYLWLAKKPILSMKYWYGWLLLKMPSEGVFSNNGEDNFLGPTKGTGGLQHHKFLIFDGKQHPKNIWFHGCLNHP